MSFSPWEFQNPFIPYTRILAEDVNPNFSGISASFTYVADELNNYRPRLPGNFTGSISIPDQNYFNTLLSIDENGDMALLPVTDFQLALDKDLTIKTSTAQQMTVDGNNHTDWFNMQYEASGEENIEVLVGEATAMTESGQGVAKGSVIMFMQDSDTPLTFAPLPGVTIKCDGLLQAYAKYSVVVLVALDQYTWVLGGSTLPAEIEV